MQCRCKPQKISEVVCRMAVKYTGGPNAILPKFKWLHFVAQK